MCVTKLKILVTGSKGFVGGAIARYLAADYSITALTHENFDVCDRVLLFSKIEEYSSYDVLIHSAAYLGDDVEKLYSTNVFGMQNICDFAIKAGIKSIVFISGAPISGIPNAFPITEETEENPLSVYHLTKLLGERILSQVKQNGIKYFILRIPSPVGFGMPKNKIFSVFVNNAKNNLPLTIYGSGNRVQNYIDVSDVAEAVRLCIKSKNSGKYLILGTEISDIDLAKLVIKFFNSKSEIIYKTDFQSDICEKWIYSGEKSKAVLGYIPKKTLNDSILSVSGDL